MRWVDGHLDLASFVLCGRDLTAPAPGDDRECIRLPALRYAGVELVFATIFTEPDAPTRPCGYARSDPAAAYSAGRSQLDIYQGLEARGELSIVRTRGDLNSTSALPKVVLLMEGADPIRGPEDVATWFEGGVRMIGLAWATGTRYAGGNRNTGPLTAEGRALVAALDEAGIIHDASHLADAAFQDLLATARGPIVATHSNCRALAGDAQRHLRDDQIEAIGARGGIVGLNLYSKFLVPGRRATIGDCVDHVQRVTRIMGHRRGVGLGSDMDGGFGPPDLPIALDHPGKLGALAQALRDAGWPEKDVEGFCWSNWRRLLQEALPSP